MSVNEEVISWANLQTNLGFGDNVLLSQTIYSLIPPQNIIPEYAIDCRRKCCDNCEYFDTFANFDLRDEDGLCLKNVANDEYGEYINDSDTFYCSYHKFKV